jgi:hypothetical protein
MLEYFISLVHHYANVYLFITGKHEDSRKGLDLNKAFVDKWVVHTAAAGYKSAFLSSE